MTGQPLARSTRQVLPLPASKSIRSDAGVTTAKFYAHVTMDDIREALESDTKSRQKSRRKMRTPH